MKSSSLKPLSTLLVFLIAGMLAVPPGVWASDHVVSPADLTNALISRAQLREQKLNLVRRFFTSDQATKALQRLPNVRGEIEQAVSNLDDQELARLSAKIDKIQHDFAAGSLTNQQLTYIVIALATAVIILVIVER